MPYTYSKARPETRSGGVLRVPGRDAAVEAIIFVIEAVAMLVLGVIAVGFYLSGCRVLGPEECRTSISRCMRHLVLVSPRFRTRTPAGRSRRPGWWFAQTL